jgi:pimeloyl-ACP methyl ester carboxylesterase
LGNARLDSDTLPNSHALRDRLLVLLQPGRTVAAAGGSLLLAYDDAEQLARIAAPTLLIWGERDALFPRDDQDRVMVAIRGATLRIYPETGYCPNWERPEQVAADLSGFLRES